MFRRLIIAVQRYLRHEAERMLEGAWWEEEA